MNDYNPKIYVACLSAYNSGKLHGVWIDALQDVDAIQDAINDMLANSPEVDAEEWAIHGYDDFGTLSLGEYPGIDAVQELAFFLKKYGEEVGEAVYAYAYDLDKAKRIVEDCYCGEYRSEKDYAEELYNDIYEIPNHLAPYICYESIARDLFISDYFSVGSQNGIHVFRYQ
jgi:antirestriction protein